MHYLYRHIRLDKDEPFYIGIGTVYKQDLNSKNIKLYYKRAYSIQNKNKIWNRIFKKSNYEVEIIMESTNYNFIKSKEIEFIKLYGRLDLKLGILANLTDGGDGTLNHKVTEEHRIKLRNGKIGKKDSEITKLKKSKYSKNRTKSHTENILNKIKKPVLQFSLNGEFIKKWDSLLSAETNNYGYIRGCLNGKQKTAGGYFWIYEKNWRKMKVKIDKGDFIEEVQNGKRIKYINI